MMDAARLFAHRAVENCRTFDSLSFLLRLRLFQLKKDSSYTKHTCQEPRT